MKEIQVASPLLPGVFFFKNMHLEKISEFVHRFLLIAITRAGCWIRVDMVIFICLFHNF